MCVELEQIKKRKTGRAPLEILCGQKKKMKEEGRMKPETKQREEEEKKTKEHKALERKKKKSTATCRDTPVETADGGRKPKYKIDKEKLTHAQRD